MLVYLDTSALAKWYLNEPGSAAFCAWVQGQEDTHISTLTVLELRCLLARRRRAGDFSAEMEQRIFSTFQNDVHQGHLIQAATQDDQIDTAVGLLEQLSHLPLRTLDALHLGIAQAIGAESLATADRVMADAATALGLKVFRRWSPHSP